MVFVYIVANLTCNMNKSLFALILVLVMAQLLKQFTSFKTMIKRMKYMCNTVISQPHNSAGS